MYTNYHHHGHRTHNSAPSTSSEGLIILAGTFGSILVFLTLCMLAQYYIRGHDEHDSDYERNIDLEASLPPFARQRSKNYRTFPSSSQEAFLQDPEIRRMMRDERLRDNVAGIYRICAQRNAGEGSASSSSSDSESEDGYRETPRKEEEEDESSESESESDSESSSDSDDDSVEAADAQELIGMRRSPLPKRVTLLRGIRG
ncbi:hypothetical protein EKO04_001592 [Ascochyta lentis]|uniref:Uncharacterized protein n=1 Tax=Ascochyta lentis TaxID=205686 RepID=A0A8H7MH31_9PLEO|nr:hypothetical protein EKO04_001592 [Ascochyta lentis]